ncbi:uncharacterized protein F4817DRAFT_330449 [Daldinia loculata]|uniref:uncharacterized protein n=1 Tax=Daldinia loculata TaxID=103429 RepID=UPI0020C35B97|nr:uncharacterized protein F4817DRAFT_330449 [Daldinia loculata]KAI1649464.1 hypothetical protein F4817DRAFT_330449 [Daldinia loculata]
MAGDVALWSAIMMDKRDFLQGVTENALNSPYCPNLGSKWCNFACTLAPGMPRTVHQLAPHPGLELRRIACIIRSLPPT